MTGPGYGEATINEATGFSGFGGHLLISDDRPDAARAGATAESVEAASQIAGLGVTDAEQLLALASIPASARSWRRRSPASRRWWIGRCRCCRPIGCW